MAEIQYYYVGADADYFVKPVILGDVVDGELNATWVKPDTSTPDGYMVYSQTSPMSKATRQQEALFFTKQAAQQHADLLAKINKTKALLSPDRGGE